MAITTGARRNGKTTAMLQTIREATARGEHVHIAGPAGLRCINGPAECHAEHRTSAQLERELRR